VEENFSVEVGSRDQTLLETTPEIRLLAYTWRPDLEMRGLAWIILDTICLTDISNNRYIQGGLLNFSILQ